MVAATVFFNACAALGTVFGVRRDVVGGFGIVGAFGEPQLDRFAIGWSVIFTATFETIRAVAIFANYPLRLRFFGFDYN